MQLRILAAVLTTACGLFGAAPADARELSNGLSANGLSANGLSANGLSANGLSANGLSANGLSANGRSANGAAAGTDRVEAVVLQDGSRVTLR